VHVPNGFMDAPTALGAGAVAAAGVALCLRKARDELDERTAPLAGLVAAFVFAVQMLNFPIGLGTSGHLMGGALAAILVGPWTGALCVTVVLIVQCLLFADGGVTMLGVNVILMAFVTTAVGYAVFRALLRVSPRGRTAVVVASGVAALVSVPTAALAFAGLYAAGGAASVPLGGLTAAMVGIHVLIGIGEGVITALTVGSVLAVRPDLVYGARDLPSRTLELRSPSPTH
jgi:cobalt/nickel transport system permease protein